MAVRKAVIPAAGLGTRFLPATKAQAKEMLPVVDKPQVQYAVEEAVRAGMDDVLLVTSRGKGALEDHFDRAGELEARLEASGKLDELEEIRALTRLARVHSVRQNEPLGFGHAVAQARSHVGGEPFAVLVPDEIVPVPLPGEPALMQRLVEIHEETGGSVVAVQEVAMEDVSAYGVVTPEPFRGDVVRVAEIVEKPAPQDAASNLASRGRYLLAPELFDALDRTTPGVGNEIQLTDAINELAKTHPVYAYVYRGPIFDVGKKLDYVKATVQLALRRDDLAKPVREFLAELVARFE
ncbi:MAG TPA: UTP--glucose-1-phosphate uridylyltransferase [Actinomycetota bacterium]|nr:UTP--glucose-1-phosphate uridylyltransferase [Actinomycetota bacterium]